MLVVMCVFVCAYVCVRFLCVSVQVYEHMYQTVDATGSEELRATATAKATVAAFAASEGQGHPRIVELEKVRQLLYVFIVV